MKLHPILWISSNQPLRCDVIIIIRLQIGHTRLTQAHMCTHLDPLSCEHCPQEVSLSVDHMFICPALLSNTLSTQRNPIRQSTTISKHLSYLQSVNFLSRIHIIDPV